MVVDLNHEKIRYCGRIDRSDEKHPEFVYPASYLKFRFWGKEASITVTNRRNYWDSFVGIIVDGQQKSVEIEADGTTTITLVKEEEEKEHDVMVFKRMDSCHVYRIDMLELSEGSRLLDLPELPKRKIEIYGDSVSAGELSEAIDYVGKPDPEHRGEFSNSWYSYGWILARSLNAQLHDIAQGGAALLDHTGWFCDPDYVGMETIWDKIHYNPYFEKSTKWDFKEYVPQLVLVAIGQNDSHPEDYMKEDIECDKAKIWREHYKMFLQSLRNVYPEATIICMTTLLEHDPSWDVSIDRVCKELEDERILHYQFTRNGVGTPGHVRIPEAQEMAEELERFISGLEIIGW